MSNKPTNSNDRVRITGLFKKVSKASGKVYFNGEGEINGVKVGLQLWENTEKRGDNSPDFTIYQVPLYVPKTDVASTQTKTVTKPAPKTVKPQAKAEEVDDFV